MAMLLCGSENQTQAELRRVLGFEYAGIATEAIASVIKQLTSSILSSEGSYILTSANSVLIQEGFKVKEDYKSIVKEYFKALLVEVNFEENSQNVVNLINNWVKENTNNMIPKLLQELGRDTLVVLLNAVYFKGMWLQKFDKQSTRPLEFFNYGDERKIKLVDMMRIKDVFFFVENSSFKALQLPYVSENIGMLILLPHNRNGLEALEATLSPSFIHDLSKCMVKRKVDVSLPRFKLEYSKSLVSFFQQLGIVRLFEDGAAELGGISNSEELVVSDIVHKAVLEVNEEGSEAAAATAVVVGLARCARKPAPVPVFKVNHPFVFVIYETKNKMILFMGRVEEL